MSLVLDARVAARGVTVHLEVPAGTTTAIVGPNGSGKSTVLALLAGLVRPDDATEVDRSAATLDGDELLVLPPHRRPIALLAQDPLLFPHLSVLDNAAFAPRSKGAERQAARAIARRYLTDVGLADLAGRRPSELSGGQAQRAALARALAAEPRLLLLDEPLAALDVSVAAEVRQTLRAVLRGRTAIVVTHDLLDAVLLADRIAVMADGRIVEEGPATEVMGQPRTSFAAELGDWNLIEGVAAGPDVLRTAGGLEVRGIADPALPPGTAAVAIFRPAAVAVHDHPPGGSPRNVFAVEVAALAPQGHLIRVRAGGLSADITPDAVADLDLREGTQVFLAVKTAEVAIYSR